MNKQDRKELQNALDLMEEAREIIERLKDAEREKFGNLSEGLQQAENGQRFESNADTLDEAYDSLDSAIDNVKTAME